MLDVSAVPITMTVHPDEDRQARLDEPRLAARVFFVSWTGWLTTVFCTPLFPAVVTVFRSRPSWWLFTMSAVVAAAI